MRAALRDDAAEERAEEGPGGEAAGARGRPTRKRARTAQESVPSGTEDSIAARSLTTRAAEQAVVRAEALEVDQDDRTRVRVGSTKTWFR